jgi:hypothetical protein
VIKETDAATSVKATKPSVRSMSSMAAPSDESKKTTPVEPDEVPRPRSVNPTMEEEAQRPSRATTEQLDSRLSRSRSSTTTIPRKKRKEAGH